MPYAEVEKRRAMLQALYEMLETADDIPIMVGSAEVHVFGSQMDLTQRESERLFIRLLEEGFIRAQRQRDGSLYMSVYGAVFAVAAVEDLTDKGLRAIDVLPPEDSLQGVITVLEQYLNDLEHSQVVNSRPVMHHPFRP